MRFEIDRLIYWLKILLAIIIIFKSLQYSIQCLFLSIQKAAIIILFYFYWLTHKDNINQFKL